MFATTIGQEATRRNEVSLSKLQTNQQNKETHVTNIYGVPIYGRHLTDLLVNKTFPKPSSYEAYSLEGRGRINN